jgi:hypothetical protein
MRFFLLAGFAVTTLLATDAALAARPRRFGPNANHVPGVTPNKQMEVGAYGKAVYPKYIGGFHARELQNIGVPNGDIGILGNGIQRNPW